MTDRPDPPSPVRTLYLALLLTLSGVLWWQPLSRTLGLALSDEAYTHILLVLPVSIGFLYLERKTLASTPASGLNLSAFGLIAALLIAGFAKWGAAGLSPDVRLSLSMLALVVWWVASFVVCFGTRKFHALIFPLCFLLWIVPLPSAAVDEVVYFLQHQSALAARIMFLAVGVPVAQDGVMLSLPNLDIEVARECSSIRSSLLLVITTMVLARLFLRSWWRKALLIAAAVPLAAIKNGFRIFTITELATHVDPGFFDGNLHHRGGILFLAIALVTVVALLWGLRWTEAVRVRVSSAH